MQQVDLNEARMHLPNLIDAAIEGEEVIIMKGDQPLVKLVPISTAKLRRQRGSAKGMIRISEDFDEPLEDFKEYM
ncbi:MAG: type II toxin-antitoxin system Phd/YefM family antitoxin [bacterium]